MKRRTLLTGGAGFALSAHAAALSAFSLKQPARVILVVGGDYYRYQAILVATVKGLAQRGLIRSADFLMPVGSQAIQPLWSQLVEHTGVGDALTFLSDGFYNYAWSDEERKVVVQTVKERLRTRRDVDLILTFGTDASYDMARTVNDVPVVSLNSSDPVATGIVKSAEDSGKDNVHAMVTVDYWSWQLMRFYAIFRFRRLAIVATDANRFRSGVEDAKKLAAEHGFRVIVRTYASDDRALEESYLRFREAVRQAIDEDGADAVYLTWFPASDKEMPDLVKLFTDRGVPAFSQTGAEEVQRGILLGVGAENIEAMGLFEAKVIEKIILGAKPRSVSQIYAQDQGIVVNLKTAMQMGWQPPMGLLVTAEKTFTTQSGGLR